MARIPNNPINKTWLIRRYLFGLDLTDDDANQYPDAAYDHAAEAAINYLETELDILVVDRMVDIVERQDLEVLNRDDWRFFTLDRAPIRGISKLEMVYGGDEDPTKILEVPKQWIRTSDNEAGQIEIVPQAGTAGAPFVQAIGGFAIWAGAALPSMASHLPGFWRTTYRAGFYPGHSSDDLDVSQLVYTLPSDVTEVDGQVFVELDYRSGAATQFTIIGVDKTTGLSATEVVVMGPAKTRKVSRRTWKAITSITLASPGTIGQDAAGVRVGASSWTTGIEHGIPHDLLHVAGMYASFLLLNPAGDMVAGSGMQALSLSMDGLSQNTTTTNSSTNAGFGARIIQYWQDIKRLMPALRSRYRRGSMIQVA